MRTVEKVSTEARKFIQQYYAETNKGCAKQRWEAIVEELQTTETYTHTYDELSYGAKLAWRNSNRCIGRLFWRTLQVLDYRSVKNEGVFIDALHEYLDTVERQKRIKNTIAIFPPLSPTQSTPPAFEIKNYTLLMYAGYATSQGIMGDPDKVEFTKHCESLGWHGAGTAFDLLPVVYSVNGEEDKFHQLPENLVTEIKITHPEHAFFEALNLKWYKLPIISSMDLEIGGIVYPTTPFNGWYMLDEVATRNFGDTNRYNMLPKIAQHLGLDMKSPFWKERALLVLNEAVYHSYHAAGAMIVDHHTATEQFMRFVQQESKKGRAVTGEWSWLIPPTMSSTTEVFHCKFQDEIKYPNFTTAK